MINIENLKFLLENIPTVLQYWLPGYWAIFLFGHLCSKKIGEKIRLPLSLILSYLSISLISIVHQFDNILVLSGISFLFLTVVAICAALVHSSKWFKFIMVKLFHKTPNDDIWRDVLDLDNGSNLKVYLKDKDYYLIGHHKNHEENGNDSWFAISAYGKFDAETDEVVDNRYMDKENIIATFRLSDVEHIEIFN